MPSEIDAIDRRIIQLKIELQSLKKESDKTAKGGVTSLKKEISDLQEKMDQMKVHWSGEKISSKRSKY
jgi:ATP-dependent Clp protease ATP-binding subunit ClpB